MKELTYAGLFPPAVERHADQLASFDGCCGNTYGGHGRGSASTSVLAPAARAR